MTELEARLLRKALDGALPRLLDAGFTPNVLAEPYGTAFTRIIKHYKKYREIPSAVTAKELLKDLGRVVALEKESRDSAEYYWDKILDSALHNKMVELFDELAVKQEEGKLFGRPLLDQILTKTRELNDRYSPHGSASHSSAGIGHQLIDEYLAMEAGKIVGIPIDPRFRGLADALVSLKPAQITTIIARSKVGKTWLALFLCLHAAHNNYRILVSSMEMVKEALVCRLVCMDQGLNYDAALKGRLIKDQREKYITAMQEADRVEGVWKNIRFMNPAEIKDISSVERQAHAFDANIVLADAFYDFPAEGSYEADWQQIRHNLRAVREVSLATRRHWLLTAQFGKGAKRSADDYSVGGTDAFNFVSNTTIYMLQSAKDRDLSCVYIKVGRAREVNASAKPWKHHWDFLNMNVNPISMAASSYESEKGFSRK